MALSRISITIPEDLVHAADQVARRLDRSRSWVLVDALREYLDRAGPLPVPPPAVAEPRTGYRPTSGGVGEQRRAQLMADLALSPDERVREAERTARISDLRRPEEGSRRDRVRLFDRYEDYLEWDRLERLRP